jgi:WD40 repeat protein
MRFAGPVALSLLMLVNCNDRAPRRSAPAPRPSASTSVALLGPRDAGAPPKETHETAPVDDGPSAAALAAMRATFQKAAQAEPTDPAKAAALYEKANAAVPSLAALLGEARAAKAKGDTALARRSLARALAFAEHAGGTPRVVVTPLVARDDTARVLDVENDFAILSMDADRLIVRQDLASGALGVITALPDVSTIYAASPHLAVIKAPGSPLGLLALGVDDATTAEPLDAVRFVDGAAISPDETLLGFAADSGAVVIDARTKKTVGKVAFPDEPRNVVGFTRSGKHLVVTRNGSICVLSAPSWNACDPSPALRGVGWPGLIALGGELVAFAPDDKTFRVFDTRIGRTIETLHGHFASVSSLALTPDGTTLVSSSFSRTVTWDLATHARGSLAYEDQESHDFQPHFSPDGKRSVDAAWDGAIVRDVSALPVWQPMIASGWAPIAKTSPVATFAPSGHLWVGGNRYVANVDLHAGTIRAYPLFGRAMALAVSPDESRFAADDWYGNMGANLYLVEASGKRVWMTNGYTMIGGMRFDGSKLLVDAGQSVATYDLATANATYAPQASPWPYHPIVSPDKKLRVVPNDDGSLTVTDARGRSSTLELGPDALVVTRAGKSQVGGNKASARCNVGDWWLPLEACAPVLGAVSL